MLRRLVTPFRGRGFKNPLYIGLSARLGGFKARRQALAIEKIGFCKPSQAAVHPNNSPQNAR